MISPILLFGLPRSGTTWIGKIFDSHPDTFYRHEPDSSQRIGFMPLLADVSDSAVLARSINEYLHSISATKAPKVAAKLPIFRKSYMSAGRALWVQTSVLAAKAGQCANLDLPVFGQPRVAGKPGLRLVWKSIESLGRLGAISHHVEDAYAVPVLRHPCGYIASVLRGEQRKSFGDAPASSEDYGMFAELVVTPQAKRVGLTMVELSRMQPEERLAWRWRLFNEKVLEDLAGRDRYALACYERICRDPVQEMKNIFRLVELPWSDQTEQFVAASTNSEQKAYYSVIKNPWRSAQKWRHELPPETIRRVLAVTRNSEPGRIVLDQTHESPRTHHVIRSPRVPGTTPQPVLSTTSLQQ